MWPYNGLGGFLHSCIGDNVVTIFDEDASIAMGNNSTAYLEKYSKKEMGRQDRETFSRGWTTVVLREGMTMWVPFGHMHTVIPLSNKRESLMGALKKAKDKSRPGRSKNGEESEYSSILFVPVLGQKDAQKPPKIVCATAGRLMTNRCFTTESWEKNQAWRDYSDQLEEIVKKTNNKSADLEPAAEATAPVAEAVMPLES